MSVLVPIKHSVGLNKCHLILTNRLFYEESGRLSTDYHQYKEGVPYFPINNKLMKDNTSSSENFLLRKKSLIKNINITYMDSSSILRRGGDTCCSSDSVSCKQNMSQYMKNTFPYTKHHPIKFRVKTGSWTWKTDRKRKVVALNENTTRQSRKKVCVVYRIKYTE